MKPPSSREPQSSVRPEGSIHPEGSLRPPGFAQMDTGKVTPRPLVAVEAVPEGQQAQLLLLTGTNAGQVFPLDGGHREFVIGRASSAEVCIEDVEASRAHCKITVVGDGPIKKYVIEICVRRTARS